MRTPFATLGSSSRLHVLIVCLVGLGMTVGCTDSDDARSPRAASTPEPRSLQSCGVPRPQSEPDVSLVPRELILGGEVQRVSSTRGFNIAIVALDGSVEEVFESYKRVAPKVGLEVVDEDFEGFEAELYVRRANALGLIQIRQTGCEGTLLAYLNLPKSH